jgi:hypothetical protein
MMGPVRYLTSRPSKSTCLLKRSIRHCWKEVDNRACCPGRSDPFLHDVILTYVTWNTVVTGSISVRTISDRLTTPTSFPAGMR